MKTKWIAELFLKFLGIQQLLDALWGAQQVVRLWYWYRLPAGDIHRQWLSSSGQSSMLFVFQFLVGLLLIVFAGRIVDRLVTKHGAGYEEPSGFRLVSPAGFRFCFTLLGISFLVHALLAPCAGLILQESSASQTWPSVGYQWTALLGAILPLAIGLYLVLGGGWLVRLAWKKQNAQPTQR